MIEHTKAGIKAHNSPEDTIEFERIGPTILITTVEKDRDGISQACVELSQEQWDAIVKRLEAIKPAYLNPDPVPEPDLQNVPAMRLVENPAHLRPDAFIHDSKLFEAPSPVNKGLTPVETITRDGMNYHNYKHPTSTYD